MKKFTSVSSRVAALPLNDVDTDMILPAQYLTSTSTSGYGDKLFQRLRGSDQELFLNNPDLQDAKILIVGENFGCGSSREHAVWALKGAGIEVIIGTTFADIFSSNAVKNGLLLVPFNKDEVETLFRTANSEKLFATVDLQNQSVSFSDRTTYSFEYDLFNKTCLLEGLDELDYLLNRKAEIDRFFRLREAHGS